jgi:opacity protein-like surface antigen
MGLTAPSHAQQAVIGKWALGGAFTYNVPTFGLASWYGNTPKWGVNFTYVTSQRTSVELEFNHSRDSNGSLVARTFNWPIDEKNYRSPDASATMTWNNLAINGIVRLMAGPVFESERYAPYLIVGAGFYRYSSKTAGLVWPGQSKAVTGAASLNDPNPGPDRSLLIPDAEDSRPALSFNLGLGIEAFITHNISLDVRSRYHLSIGELRPVNSYGLRQTFPLQQFDVGGGLKFYFKQQVK